MSILSGSHDKMRSENSENGSPDQVPTEEEGGRDKFGQVYLKSLSGPVFSLNSGGVSVR